MKNITELTIKDSTIGALLEALAKEYDATVETDCSESILNIPSTAGEGSFIGFSFNNGMDLLTINVQLKKDLILNFEPNDNPPLSFQFCLEGSMVHIFNNGQMRYQLTPLFGAITSTPEGKSQCFKIPAFQKIAVTMLLFDRSLYQEKLACELEKMPDKLEAIFSAQTHSPSFLYQTNYSISIGECINTIVQNDYEGLVRSTFIEAKSLELLSLQIKQFKDDENPIGKQVLMRNFDIEKIREAKSLLVQDLSKHTTIPELAKRVGINQQKLKQGFKAIYDKTIFNYLRDERLNAAKMLIIDGSYSISDIAGRVGYSNKGHFAKRFKEKFGVRPKDYASSIRHEFMDN